MCISQPPPEEDQWQASVHAVAGREMRLWLVVLLFREGCHSSPWADLSQAASAVSADAAS